LSLEEDVDAPQKGSYPFVVLNPMDPLTRLLSGSFSTDTDDIVRPVVLLMERDWRVARSDPLRPVTNLDMEAAWEGAYAHYSRVKESAGFITLSAQFSEEGRFSRLAPLLFCKKKRLFLHLPCPRCGSSLTLSTDDDLLTRSGLAPYSRSLRRYLSCLSSLCADNPIFYVYEKESFDPPGLRDRDDLIQDLLFSAGVADSVFPCHLCPDRGDCLPQGGQFQKRLVPFSFYPSYLLLFEAPSMNALDYSLLLSGASSREIAARLKTNGESARAQMVERFGGRDEGGFLFEKHTRLFLETLYLKLSLLATIFRNLSTEDTLTHPDFALSIERIWVSMSAQKSLLPSYWTFTAQPIDIHWASSRDIPGLQVAPDLHYLALTWFSVLVTAEKKGPGPIRQAILVWLKEAAHFAEGSILEPTGPAKSDQPFNPDDLFWVPTSNPDGYGEVETSLWQRSLALGWSLLHASERVRGWSREAFIEELETLRNDVHAAMFDAHPILAAPAAASAADDAVIREILEDVIRKWRSRPDTHAAETTEDDEEVLQTVVVSARTAEGTTTGTSKEAVSSAPTPPAVSHAAEARLQGTLTIHTTPSTLPSVKLSEPSEESDSAMFSMDDEAMERTVIISEGIVDGKTQSTEQKDSDEEIEKTVLISANALMASETATPVSKKTGTKPAHEEEMAETMIITLSNKDKIE
jgi:hypothetical protein